MKKKHFPGILTIKEKRRFVETLLILAGLMGAIYNSLSTINLFVLFGVLSIIYIIWISIVKKKIKKRKFNSFEKIINWIFSASVGASFSGLIASMGLIGSISTNGSINIMFAGWIFVYVVLSILLTLVLGLRD